MRPAQASEVIQEIAQAQPQNYTVLYVNAQAGNDANDGSDRAPFRTITQALRQAPLNSIIKLAAGTYSQQSGEVFPIELQSGVTIQGEISDRGQSTIIQGSGLFLSKTFARQQVAIIGANRAGLQGVTVSNPTEQGYGVWVESSSPVISDSTFTGSGHDGVSIVGNSAPILRNNYFYSNGANGITIYGTSRPELRENIFERTGFGINIAQNSAPRLLGNRITQNKDGIVVQGSATPVLRSNVIDGNERDGLVAIGESRPDLGTTADQGNNTFANNGNLDVNAQASRQVIPSVGNQLTRTAGRLDATANWVAELPQALSDRRILQRVTPIETPAIARSMPATTFPVPTPESPVAAASGTTQELTFSRPDSSASSITVPIPVPIRKVSVAATPSPLLAMTPSLSSTTAVSMISMIPIAVQPGSGTGRSLPMPKQAVKIPIPATMTFNNLVMPNRGIPENGMPPASNVLPVPASAIPIGNVGDLSSVTVWRKTGRNNDRSTSSRAPNPQVAATLHYRVIVEMADGSALRSIVPNAFTAVSGGRQVLQAGAFAEQGKASQLLQRLTSQGVHASIEQF